MVIIHTNTLTGIQWALDRPDSYQEWRTNKLTGMSDTVAQAGPVDIKDLGNPSESERAELARRCTISNAAFYASAKNADDPEAVRDQLKGFATAMGLEIAEKHRSAGRNGIVALTVSNKDSQRGYIPYTTKPMNWHTDGYYNAPDQKIRAMVLHCVRPANDGGINQFLDPEIAYIRVRDDNPDYIDALMHPHAMTIPENREANGNLRPASIGPVFSVDPQNGHLEMRYTARTRSISWRDDPITADAVAFLGNLLASDEPYIQTIKMDVGVGVLCNNSLHNRTGFDPNLATDSKRLLFRIRFHNRVLKG
ncbi:MAG: taurine catabolism dioxygenase TauD [Marinosulfonomonas sp.]|nr:MAG: taurine catabolism dioxygenase TauD [Marinosulfonomonas sp.]